MDRLIENSPAPSPQKVWENKNTLIPWLEPSRGGNMPPTYPSRLFISLMFVNAMHERVSRSTGHTNQDKTVWNRRKCGAETVPFEFCASLFLVLETCPFFVTFNELINVRRSAFYVCYHYYRSKVKRKGFNNSDSSIWRLLCIMLHFFFSFLFFLIGMTVCHSQRLL